MNKISVVKRGAPLRQGIKRFSIGRQSSGVGTGCTPLHELANPFKVKPYGPYERGETLALYEAYLREKIAEKNEPVCRALNTLWLAANAGEIELECFCAPLGCHGDVVVKVLDEVARARTAPPIQR